MLCFLSNRFMDVVSNIVYVHLVNSFIFQEKEICLKFMMLCQCFEDTNKLSYELDIFQLLGKVISLTSTSDIYPLLINSCTSNQSSNKVINKDVNT